MVAWLFVVVIPFILQVHSYVKFVTHKMTQHLVVPPGEAKATRNLTELCFCPVRGLILTLYITIPLGSVDFVTLYCPNTTHTEDM